jgi:hypothetical protein
MQGILHQTLGIVFIALIAWMSNYPATVLAQEAQERWRGRERTAQRADAVLEETKDTVSITHCALTIADAAEPPPDELTANFADRVNNLPDEFSSVDEVRELVGQLKVAGMLRKAREFRLTTLAGQQTEVHVGANTPRVIATKIEPQRDRSPRRIRSPQDADPAAPAPDQISAGQSDSIVTNAITMEELGTIVQVLPQIDSSGGLQVYVKYSSSDLETVPDVVLTEVPGRKPVAASRVVTQQAETAVRLKSGTAVLVQADSSHTMTDDAPKSEIRLLILAASVERAEE